MNICIVGTGNIGSALAKKLEPKGHTIVFGVRDPGNFKGKEQLGSNSKIKALPTKEAVHQSEVIIIAVPAMYAASVASQLGDVSNKVIIDTMNTVAPNEQYKTTAEAILANCNCIDVVKCFNTTGFENILDPIYKGVGIDMFTAGDSEKAVSIATQLASEVGFGAVHHLGGNAKFALIEQLALCWINLAIFQKKGRNIAFKLLHR